METGHLAFVFAMLCRSKTAAETRRCAPIKTTDIYEFACPCAKNMQRQYVCALDRLRLLKFRCAKRLPWLTVLVSKEAESFYLSLYIELRGGMNPRAANSSKESPRQAAIALPCANASMTALQMETANL